MGEEIFRATAGSYVLKPCGVSHTFWNPARTRRDRCTPVSQTGIGPSACFGFSADGYWREPVWINIDWFLMHGLADYGHEDDAERVRRTIVDLCRKEGFYEYFDPPSGQGLGSILFSWSAALLLDVLLYDGG